MKVSDAAAILAKERMTALARWDASEKDRATYYFGRADEQIHSTLAAGLPRLLAALQELVPEKIVRWDDSINKHLSCSIVPDSGQNRASVCKPDSEKRVIAIYSAFCTDSNGWLWRFSKVKTLIHECTHYTETFNSDDVIYADSAIGAHIFALNNTDKTIRNADSITGYIATFDREVAK